MLEYELVRSSRKTIGISVADGKVVVKAPKNVSKRNIDLLVFKSLDWIEKKLAISEQNKKRFADFIEYKKFLYRGRSLEKREAKTNRIVISNEAIFIPSGNDMESFKPKIIKEYRRQAAEFLSERLEVLSKFTGMTYEKFALTNARSKWGSCSSSRQIRLNWRLIMLPDGLSDYVVIHELCHTKHMNHSAEFWTCVEYFVSDYKKRRKLLKEYSAIMDVLR